MSYQARLRAERKRQLYEQDRAMRSSADRAVQPTLSTFERMLISEHKRESRAFKGATFSPELDGPRLTTQLQRVKLCLLGGQWWTLRQLVAIAGGSEAAVSARIRDLRRPEHGGYTILRERVGGVSGLWRYKLVVPPPEEIRNPLLT